MSELVLESVNVSSGCYYVLLHTGVGDKRYLKHV